MEILVANVIESKSKQLAGYSFARCIALVSTIIFIIFSDFLMPEQMFLSPQVKRT